MPKSKVIGSSLGECMNHPSGPPLLNFAGREYTRHAQQIAACSCIIVLVVTRAVRSAPRPRFCRAEIRVADYVKYFLCTHQSDSQTENMCKRYLVEDTNKDQAAGFRQSLIRRCQGCTARTIEIHTSSTRPVFQCTSVFAYHRIPNSL